MPSSSFLFSLLAHAPGLGLVCAGAVAALLLAAFFLRRRPVWKWVCVAAAFYVAVCGVFQLM